MKLKRLFTLLTSVVLACGVSAQTDVTSTYLTNADFEGDYTRFLNINSDRGVEKPVGWSVEWTQSASNDQNGMTYVGSMTQDGKTWNAHGGNKAYFTRMRWANATLNLRQTLVNLRPGSYTLSFYATASKLSSGNGSASVSVAGQSQSITVGTSETTNWTQYTINFTVTTNPYATIKVEASRTGGNFKFGIDDFTLTYDGSSYYSTILTAAQSLYDDNADWAEGADDLNAAITDATGKETVADKNAAIVALEEAMATFKETNTVDMTSRITNATFDSNISGWTTTGSDGTFQRQTSSQNNFTGGFLESWRNSWTGTWNHKNFDVSQTLSSLPNGEYTIKAAIIAVMQGSAETFEANKTSYSNKKHGGPYYIDDEKGVWLYGTSGETTAKAWANTKNSTFDGDGAEYKTATIKVENGSLTIGFKGIGSESGGTSLGTYANWIACDNWTLSYFGFDPSTLLSQITSLKSEATSLLANGDYTNVVGKERTDLTTASTLDPADEKKATLENVISQIEGAISAFTAAKANYDANAAEVTKATALGVASATIETYTAGSSTTAATALTNTQNLKVEEYNYVTTNYAYGVTLGEWISSGSNNGANFNNEHWSGNTINYKNQDDSNGRGWNSSAWDMNYNQNVMLPAGNYVFKVAGRQANSDQVDMSLVVKKGEETLGTVDDFPHNGSSARGIDKTGATKFEGENSEFANNGAGFGWEWRYVKFTLDTDATVNIAVKVDATALHMWASFGNYTLQTDNEANISLIAYNVALNDAQTALANDTYKNVTGSEKTALQAAIDAGSSLDKTDKDAIDAAKTVLNDATSAFTAAKSAYDAFVAAKAVEYADNLPYASSTKYAAIGTAQAATATSAADATTKTNAIISAYRKYVESNALAEGVVGAEDKTNLIADPNFAGVTIDGTSAGAWTFDQTGGSANINTNEPFTDGENNSSYSYFDYYNGSNNNQNIHQVIKNLEPGCYILTATGRGHVNFNGNLQLYVVGKASVNIPAIGNSGGVFDRGWNDATLMFRQTTTSDITIGVKTDNSQSQWWGATRFRLVKIADLINEAETYTVTAGTRDVVLNRTIKADTWNTFCVPFDITNEELVAKFGADVAVAEFSENSADENDVQVAFNSMTTPAITANTPVLLKGNAGTSFEFSGKLIKEGDAKVTGTNVDFVGSYAASIQVAAGNYFISNNTLYKSAGQNTLKGTRAYIDAKNVSNVRMFIDDMETSISEIDNDSMRNGEIIYNMAGQRVSKAQKGLYIVNGRKVIVK